MANPSASVVIRLVDGTDAHVGAQINADGSLNLNSGSGAATTHVHANAVNVADGTNPARLMAVSSTGSVGA